MASDYDATEFVDSDFQARQSVQASASALVDSADFPSATPYATPGRSKTRHETKTLDLRCQWRGAVNLAATPYDASAGDQPTSSKIAKATRSAATVRSERGYLDTNYDASPAKRRKSSRCHFGQNYAVNEVRNT